MSFEKISKLTLHDNSSTGSRNVPCGKRDMTKQILSLRNYVNSPKTLIIFPCILSQTLHEKNVYILQITKGEFPFKLLTNNYSITRTYSLICSIDISLMEPQMKYKTKQQI